MTEFFHSIAAMLLFLAALGIVFVGGETIVKTVAVKELAYQGEVVYEKAGIESQYCIKGEDLLLKLLSGSVIDIQICCCDGNEIEFLAGEKGEEVLQKASFSFDSEYRLEYGYSNKGSTKVLRFVECKKE